MKNETTPQVAVPASSPAASAINEQPSSGTKAAASLLELAERCEAAAGPDHQLDREIIKELRPIIDPHDRMATPYPRFTASLDAAMTLVPEGWGRVLRDCDTDEGAAAFARLYSPDFKSVTWGKGSDWITDRISGQEAVSRAASFPLTICAAALRARAAS